MASEFNIKVLSKLSGLGKEISLNEAFEVATTRSVTLDTATYNYRTLATAATAEALDLGDITTIDYIVIKCVSGGKLDVDCDFDSSFNADIEIEEGEVAMFCPSGTVYVKDNAGTETPSYEFIVAGRT